MVKQPVVESTLSERNIAFARRSSSCATNMSRTSNNSDYSQAQPSNDSREPIISQANSITTSLQFPHTDNSNHPIYLPLTNQYLALLTLPRAETNKQQKAKNILSFSPPSHRHTYHKTVQICSASTNNPQSTRPRRFSHQHAHQTRKRKTISRLQTKSTDQRKPTATRVGRIFKLVHPPKTPTQTMSSNNPHPFAPFCIFSLSFVCPLSLA